MTEFYQRGNIERIIKYRYQLYRCGGGKVPGQGHVIKVSVPYFKGEYEEGGIVLKIQCDKHPGTYAWFVGTISQAK